jgi:hypothetical protein
MTESGVAATSMLLSGHDTPVWENRALLLTASQYTRLQTSSLSDYRSIDVRPPDHRMEYHTLRGHLMFSPGFSSSRASGGGKRARLTRLRKAPVQHQLLIITSTPSKMGSTSTQTKIGLSSKASSSRSCRHQQG